MEDPVEKKKKSFWWGLVKKLGWQGIGLLLLLGFFMVFLFQNIEPMKVNFLWWRFIELPKLYFVGLFYLLGFISGILGFLWFRKS